MTKTIKEITVNFSADGIVLCLKQKAPGEKLLLHFPLKQQSYTLVRIQGIPDRDKLLRAGSGEAAGFIQLEWKSTKQGIPSEINDQQV